MLDGIESNPVYAKWKAADKYTVLDHAEIPGTPIIDPVTLGIGIEPSIPFTYNALIGQSAVFLETLFFFDWHIEELQAGEYYLDLLIKKNNTEARIIVMNESLIDFAAAGGSMAAGAAVGSFFLPPVGTVVGAATGAAVNFAINYPIPILGDKSLVQFTKDGINAGIDKTSEYINNQVNELKEKFNEAIDNVSDGVNKAINNIGNKLANVFW